MTTLRCLLVSAVPAALLAAGLGGCPQNTTGGTNTDPTSIDDLTSGERDSITAALSAVTGLNLSGSSLQSASEFDGQQQTSLDTNTDVTIGTCPETTFSPDSNSLSFAMTLNFGAGCTPTGVEDLTCLGSASGSINLLTRELDATFTGFECNEQGVNGSVAVTYSYTSSTFTLDGGWDLEVTLEGDEFATIGDGAASYNNSTTYATISDFDGTITDGTQTFDCEMTSVAASFATYGNYVPDAGQIRLSNDDVRTITMRFSTSSPTTGVVEVSIDGSPFFEVNLSDL